MTVRLICASHTPLMDHVEADPAIDAEVRSAFARLGDEVRAFDPELVIQFAPDHFKGFFYDMLPPFTVGIRAEAIGDYDIGSGAFDKSEEHTSELQSLMRISYAVFCLKKKKT